MTERSKGNRGMNIGYGLATALLMLSTSIASAADASASIIGQWRIVSGATDNYATTYLDTKVNDPRYVGRVIHFDRDSVSGELIKDIDCQQPAYRAQPPMTLNAAILKTSGERRAEPKIPVAGDFDLASYGNQKVTPILLQCQKGYLGPDGEAMDNWVALLSADKMVMNWDDGSYFVLQRVKAGEKVTPSFSCSARLNAVEQTICASDDLAAWDVSVTDAWKTQLLEQQENDPADKAAVAQIKSAQRAWLAKRNQCQADAACIKKSMKARVSELSSKTY